MTLFGSPAPAKTSVVTYWPTGTAADPAGTAAPDGTETREGESQVPAFERRARLRDERHRLVSEVRRRDGASHREINAWLNRKLGISSVEQATLSELERSVELLVGKLTRKR
jgi:hypothetical protein